MFCTTCGFELREGDRYCPHCGKSSKPAAGETPSANPAAQKRLMRDMRQKNIAGVCSGLANYLDVDVTLVRIVWLCSFFLWGVGFIAYLACWIVMPKDFGDTPMPDASASPASASTTEASATSSETKPDPSPSNTETGSSPA